MGWLPYDYYMATPYEFLAALEGYYDKLEQQAGITRLSTFYIIKALGAKIKKPQDFWPMFGDELQPKDTFVVDAEMWEKIKKTHKIK